MAQDTAMVAAQVSNIKAENQMIRAQTRNLNQQIRLNQQVPLTHKRMYDPIRGEFVYVPTSDYAAGQMVRPISNIGDDVREKWRLEQRMRPVGRVDSPRGRNIPLGRPVYPRGKLDLPRR